MEGGGEGELVEWVGGGGWGEEGLGGLREN